MPFAVRLPPVGDKEFSIPGVEEGGTEFFKLFLKGMVHTIDLANLKEE